MNYLNSKKLIIPFFFLFVCNALSAQLLLVELLGARKNKYDVLIGFTDSYKAVERVTLHDLGEDYIVGTQVNYLDKLVPFGLNESRYAQEYPIEKIDYLKVKSRKKVVRNAIIGGVIGLGTGLLYSKSQRPKDDFLFTKEAYYVMYGLTGVVGGATIGALATMRVKIPINGKKANYEKHRKQLMKYIQ